MAIVTTTAVKHDGEDMHDDNDDDEMSSNDVNSSGDEESMDDDSGDEQHPQSTNNSNGNGNTNNSNGDQYAEQCTFDLTNLLAINTHQVNAAELYQTNNNSNSNKSKNNKLNTNNPEWYTNQPTIIPSSTNTNTQHHHDVNESMLLAKAAEGTTQLLEELWKLPMEKTDVGALAKLPSSSSGGEIIKLPRSLPPPPPKQLTKWEQFALQRGIAPKSKRSRKVRRSHRRLEAPHGLTPNQGQRRSRIMAHHRSQEK